MRCTFSARWQTPSFRYTRQPSGPLSSKDERALRLLFGAVRRNVFDTLNSPYILLSFDEMDWLFWGFRAYLLRDVTQKASDTGCWMLDTGCWIWDTRWLPHTYQGKQRLRLPGGSRFVFAVKTVAKATTTSPFVVFSGLLRLNLIPIGILDGYRILDAGYGINRDSLTSCIPYPASRILHRFRAPRA